LHKQYQLVFGLPARRLVAILGKSDSNESAQADDEGRDGEAGPPFYAPELPG
jgi:hypothetical protein